MKTGIYTTLKLMVFVAVLGMSNFSMYAHAGGFPQNTSDSLGEVVDPLDELHHLIDDIQRKSSGKKSEKLEGIQQVLHLFEKKLKNIDVDAYVHKHFGRSTQTKCIDGGIMVLFGIMAACLYGILHDSVTARLCIEYFTSPDHSNHYQLMQNLGFEHPEQERSATKIAFIFGTLTTWWIGAILGTGIAAVSQVGDELPPVEIKDFIVPLMKLFGVMGAGSCTAGLLAYALSFFNRNTKSSMFTAVECAHNGAYLLGGLGGLYLMFWALKKRHSLAREVIRNKLLAMIDEFNKKINVAVPLDNQ